MPDDKAVSKRDIAGGLIMVAIGAAAAAKGREYGVGTLTQMGAGFLPVALGVILASLGLLVTAMAWRTLPPAPRLGIEEPTADGTDWRGVACILAGIVGFIAVGHVAGLIPASLVCVFVSALGDRTATWRSAALLAAGVTAASTVVFHYGLGIRFPLLTGG